MLKKANEIQDVLKRGTRISGKTVNVFIKTANSRKFAVFVPRRLGSAVKRNRMKRLAREIYRQHPEWFENRWVIFSIKRYHDHYAALENEIRQLVTRQ